MINISRNFGVNSKLCMIKNINTFSVVIRIGSSFNFSNELYNLQDEAKPIQKLMFCPEFKRMTVERVFRDEGFVLDWCSFRLVSSGDIFFYKLELK